MAGFAVPCFPNLPPAIENELCKAADLCEKRVQVSSLQGVGTLQSSTSCRGSVILSSENFSSFKDLSHLRPICRIDSRFRTRILWMSLKIKEIIYLCDRF